MKRQQRLPGIVAIIVCLTMAGQASGVFKNGNELYASCTSSNPAERALCIGYVEAIMDAAESEAVIQQQGKGNPYAAIPRWVAMVPTKKCNSRPGGRRRHIVTSGQPGYSKC
jgi:hypothetical protein